ncbi:MAG: Trk system potassium transporter TrkA [Muribaculaceae bacterium]
MKIVIVGAGEVGSHLAKLLSNESHDIYVIDKDEKKLAALENQNLITHIGRPTSFEVLKQVNISDCDLFIAVTPFETNNVLSCSMAKSLGAKKTVARIDNYEFFKKENKDYFTSLGVDDLIYPEYLAAEEMMVALKHTWVRNWFEMFNGELIVVGVKLRSNTTIVGMKLKEISHVSGYMHICAIKRKFEIIIPRGDDVILENDIVYIATKNEYLDKVIEACGKRQKKISKVMIMGGSRIAKRLVRLSDNKYDIKIIEIDKDKCLDLASKLPECHIVNGDGRDNEILREEHLESYDAFVALTDSSETNILGCLTAKEYGVKKTIAEVENIQFISEAEGLNIGTIINKKLLASSKIFQTLLDNDQSNAKCLALADAEVTEMIVKEGSKVTKAPVKLLKLPLEMTIAGLVRDGKGYLVQGDTELQTGDHVVVFSLSGSMHKLEKWFN